VTGIVVVQVNPEQKAERGTLANGQAEAPYQITHRFHNVLATNPSFALQPAGG
jgi:hypothetical protein